MALQVGTECKWTKNSQRLLLENFDIFQSSPSHIYHTALLDEVGAVTNPGQTHLYYLL